MRNKKEQDINYVILAEPRTGSTLLCNILENLGILNHPDEANNNYELEFDIKKNIFKNTTPDVFFHDLLSKNRVNNISGFKFMIKNLELYGKTSNYTLKYLLNSFPKDTKFIWIRRKNLLRQVISFLRAKKSNEWIAYKKDKKKTAKEHKISNIEIDSTIIKWIKDNNNFEKVLKQNNINPLFIYYEDLIDNKKVTIKKILSFLNIELRDMSIKTNLVKQSDEITENIVSNYSGIMKKIDLEKKSTFFKVVILDYIYKLILFIKRGIKKLFATNKAK